MAAGAACAAVLRAERERWRRGLPDVHVGLLADIPDEFGSAGYLPPSTYWRPGESRTVVLSMPTPTKSIGSQITVEARDLRKRHVLVTTSGGAGYRWPIRKAKKMSSESTWRELFPGVRTPLEVSNPMTSMRSAPSRRSCTPSTTRPARRTVE